MMSQKIVDIKEAYTTITSSRTSKRLKTNTHTLYYGSIYCTFKEHFWSKKKF